MVFVDAQRYLKVQSDDLDSAFSADPDDKYSKSSFESFHIEPTQFDKSGKKWLRWSERTRWWVMAIGIGILSAAVLAVCVTLLILALQKTDTDSSSDDVGDEVEDGTEYARAVMEIGLGTAAQMIRDIRQRRQLGG